MRRTAASGSLSYDKVGNRTQVQDRFGGVTTSTYDNADRLTSRQFSDGTTPLREDFLYTARDQVLTATRYSNLAGTTTISVTTYAYDGSMRMTNLQDKNSSGTLVANYTYTYDSADRITSETRNGTQVTYSYDAASELTQAGANTFGSDLNGNRNTTGYVIGADNRILSDGTYTYTYDNNGNETQRKKLDGTDIWNFTYDQRNDLVTATHQANATAALDTAITYTYDVFGQRVQQSVDADGAGPGAAVITRFSYDVAQNGTADAWADLNGSSSLTTRRIFGDGVDQPLARLSGTTVSWYLADRQGSIRELADNSTGALSDVITYGGFGDPTETNQSNGDRYKYTGREYDSTTGQYFYRDRWYDPKAGKFTSEDSLGFGAGDPNLTRYVHNGPTNATDPTGTDSVEVVEHGGEKLVFWVYEKPGFLGISTEYDRKVIGKIIGDNDVRLFAQDSGEAPKVTLQQLQQFADAWTNQYPDRSNWDSKRRDEYLQRTLKERLLKSYQPITTPTPLAQIAEPFVDLAQIVGETLGVAAVTPATIAFGPGVGGGLLFTSEDAIITGMRNLCFENERVQTLLSGGVAGLERLSGTPPAEAARIGQQVNLVVTAAFAAVAVAAPSAAMQLEAQLSLEERIRNSIQQHIAPQTRIVPGGTQHTLAQAREEFGQDQLIGVVEVSPEGARVTAGTYAASRNHRALSATNLGPLQEGQQRFGFMMMENDVIVGPSSTGFVPQVSDIPAIREALRQQGFLTPGSRVVIEESAGGPRMYYNLSTGERAP